MSFADHIRAGVEEYDARIRTFVPHYESMIDRVAEALRHVEASAPVLVDMGVGTGALAARCLEVRPEARVVGVDADAEMLRLAADRLSGHADVELVESDFLEFPVPACDAVVACLAFHHVPTPGEKRQLYRRCADALRPGGFLLSGDRFTARDPALRDAEREAWLAHLERTYTPAESRDHLAAWADEDTYFPLLDEMAWLQAAGLEPDVLWRDDGFAVVVGRKDEPG